MMRYGWLVLAAAMASVPTLAADVPTSIPHEGSFSFVNYFSAFPKTMPLGKDRVFITHEALGVSSNSTGEGLLYNASVRCLGSRYIVNGVIEDESGSCVYTRPDGDQVFTTYKASGKVGGETKVAMTFVGGTGKMAGLTGGGEGTRIVVRSAAEGMGQSVLRGVAHYKLADQKPVPAG